MASHDRPVRTRVLIVGGGPVGLVMSGLLSQRGVPHWIVERRRDTLPAPAAHVLRRRPMRVLDQLGVGQEVRRAAMPLPLDYVTWCVTLGGREIGRLDLRPRDPRTGERGPEPWTHCSQNALEPILLRRARRSAEATVVRGAECIRLSSSERGVSARIRLDDGGERDVEAAWAIAADGAGSPTRRALGIEMEGQGPLGRFCMVHFEADLTPWLEQRPGPIYWILNPESPGVLIVHHPRRSHVFMLPRVAADGEAEPDVEQRLARALDVPIPLKILSVDRWSPHVQVASRYREGRTFLVGDAAHRFPPTGGLGLNTGILEARELAVRLARVEAGEPEALLDEYERVCRPVARANADESFENMKLLAEISRVLGDGSDRAGLERRVAELDDSERRQLDKAIEAQRSHFLSDGSFPGAADAGR